MRVLIADRNARLLESISRTFARQFTIRTAVSCEQCNDLLAEGEFDLVLISEKLADGPGLQLLGQITRDSPDTLRVFAARRSRLQLLKGKLGPFGLFRTLSYPINPQELLSTLTLAQTGLALGVPAASEPASDVQPEGEARAPSAAPAQALSVVERISLTSADATFTIDVPKTILAQRRVRRSNSAPAHRPAAAAAARPAAAPSAPARNAAPEEPNTSLQSRKARREVPGAVPSPVTAAGSAAGQSTVRQARRVAPQAAPGASQSQVFASRTAPSAPRSQIVAPLQPDAANQQTPAAPQSARGQQHPAPRPEQPQAALARPAASARLPSHGGTSQPVSRSHRAASRPVAIQPAGSIRSKIVLAATSVVVFVVTTLALNLNDASVHVTRASTPGPKIDLPVAPEPAPAALATAFRPEPAVARRVEPKPEVDPASRQVTASNVPLADPSTFGHEAYEVIYNN